MTNRGACATAGGRPGPREAIISQPEWRLGCRSAACRALISIPHRFEGQWCIYDDELTAQTLDFTQYLFTTAACLNPQDWPKMAHVAILIYLNEQAEGLIIDKKVERDSRVEALLHYCCWTVTYMSPIVKFIALLCN